MTLPGPPPKPLELKRAQGNPGHQRLPSPTSTHAVGRIDPKPPRSLGLAKDGRRLWGHIASLPWVADSDAAALLNACQVADDIATLEADVAANGPTYEFRGRRLANPSMGKLLEARKLLGSLLATFGLTPADRTRLGIAEIKAQSKFDALMESRNRG